jgi:hypothetical protein
MLGYDSASFQATRNINLRLFGCFGQYEEEQRFFKGLLNKVHNLRTGITKEETIFVFADKQFDFFYIKDLYHIVKNVTFLHHTTDLAFPEYLFMSFCNMNMCYNKMFTLGSLVEIVNNIFGTHVIMNDIGHQNGYTGDGEKLEHICKLSGIELYGMENGIIDMYNLLFGDDQI